jgi:hypothetical protein
MSICEKALGSGYNICGEEESRSRRRRVGGRCRAFFRLKIRGKEARRSWMGTKMNKGFFPQKHMFFF